MGRVKLTNVPKRNKAAKAQKKLYAQKVASSILNDIIDNIDKGVANVSNASPRIVDFVTKFSNVASTNKRSAINNTTCHTADDQSATECETSSTIGVFSTNYEYTIEEVIKDIYGRNAKLIDGRKIADEIQLEIKTEIQDWMKKGHRAPCLKVVLVGDDSASCTYVAKKTEAATTVGITTETIKFPSSVTEKDLIAKIKDLNADEGVDGILVQLPVPAHMSERTICNAVDADKDVDGFHITNVGKLCLNMETFVPCTALAVIELIKRIGIETNGKNVVVCGRSKNVGLPISLLLHSDHRNELPGLEATTSLCHRNTTPEDLTRLTRKADIIISATGVVGLIKPNMVKPGACVIDVGLTRITKPDGKTKLVGDVEFEGVCDVADHITPVPGGVGPMTVAMLMRNTLQAAKNIVKRKTL